LGLHSSELFIQEVVKESPASKAGIAPGDRMLRVGGETVYSFLELKEKIQASGMRDGMVEVSWEREGRTMTARIEPTRTDRAGPTLKKDTEFTIGVIPMFDPAQPDTIIEREFNPFVLAYKGTIRMVDISWRNMVSLAKMVTGDVSIKTLGGPILIGKIAGDSLSRGLIQFLSM